MLNTILFFIFSEVTQFDQTHIKTSHPSDPKFCVLCMTLHCHICVDYYSVFWRAFYVFFFFQSKHVKYVIALKPLNPLFLGCNSSCSAHFTNSKKDINLSLTSYKIYKIIIISLALQSLYLSVFSRRDRTVRMENQRKGERVRDRDRERQSKAD